MKKKILTQIVFKSYENGGRVQLPTGSGYSPYFVVEGQTQLLAVRFVDFPETGMFEKPCNVEVELLYYAKIDYSGLTDGAKFEVREGTKTLSAGSVLKGL